MHNFKKFNYYNNTMVLESIIPLIMGLGTKFFIGFLLGTVGGFRFSGSPYISLASGGAVGALFYLII